MLGIATSAAAVYVYNRAREIAENEDRPLADVLAEMPGRLMGDLQTMGDDLRDAAEEGKEAADQESEAFEQRVADAGDEPTDGHG